MPNPVFKQLFPNAPANIGPPAKTNFQGPPTPTMLPAANPFASTNAWQPNAAQQAARMNQFNQIRRPPTAPAADPNATVTAAPTTPTPPNVLPPSYNFDPNWEGPLTGFNPDETSIPPQEWFLGSEIDPYDRPSFLGLGGERTPPPSGGVGFRPDDNLTGAYNYAITNPGLQNFPGFPASIADYAQGDNALAANIEEEFIKMAQGWSTGNDAILQQGIDVLTDLGFPSGQINAFIGSMRQMGPFGSTGQVRGAQSEFVGPGAIPAAQATIPEHFNRATFTEGEAMAAILQDLAIERDSDLARRGREQERLSDQYKDVREDPLAVALKKDVMERLGSPNAITDAVKEKMFGALADQAASLEKTQLSSLAANLGGRGLEGSGFGAGQGLKMQAERQRAILKARQNVEVQQALQSAQDKAAAQASANAFFGGEQERLGSIVNNMASLGMGGGIAQTLGREAPSMPSDIAMANYLKNSDSGGNSGLGNILGGIGGLLAAPMTGGVSLLGSLLASGSKKDE